MSEPMTEAEIARLEYLDRVATPAPWVATRVHHEERKSNDVADFVNDLWVVADADIGNPNADANLTAECRNAMRALLAEVKRLRKEIAQMRRASGEDDPLCESCGKPVDVEAGGYSFGGEDGVYLHLACVDDGAES